MSLDKSTTGHMYPNAFSRARRITSWSWSHFSSCWICIITKNNQKAFLRKKRKIRKHFRIWQNVGEKLQLLMVIIGAKVMEDREKLGAINWEFQVPRDISVFHWNPYLSILALVWTRISSTIGCYLLSRRVREQSEHRYIDQKPIYDADNSMIKSYNFHVVF